MHDAVGEWARRVYARRARFKAWLWDVCTTIILGILYWTVISEGSRVLFPMLGKKLHTLPVPFAAMLADFEIGHRLDIAHLLAIFLFLGVASLWRMIIRAWVESDEVFRKEGWNTERYKRVTFVLGFCLIGADCALFYYAVQHMGWAGNKFSWTGFLGTVAYVSVLVWCVLKSIELHKKAKDNDHDQD